MQLSLGIRGKKEVELASGAWLLRDFAKPDDKALKEELEELLTDSPPIHMVTPGGARMSVAMTNCGPLGWVSSRKGYRYSVVNPETSRPWLPMPTRFVKLATSAADRAGFADFAPDACLINLYTPGDKLILHQDKDEEDMSAPIVSVSLGLPATFLFGGFTRDAPKQRIALCHGDVVVWGGPSRLRFHGVSPLKEGEHELFSRFRINLTFRKAR